MVDGVGDRLEIQENSDSDDFLEYEQANEERYFWYHCFYITSKYGLCCIC